jgi:dTDP-4-amino-4,6-dideoxygalactose transaminase
LGNMNPERLVRLSKSCLSDSEKLAVMKALDREFLGMGSEVVRFERELEELFGRPTVCVANGTAALHLALASIGVGAQDEVLVPSLTYVASYQAISATGAKPVSCDVSCRTLTLDWRDAEKRLTSRTRAIMPVHFSGGVGELDDLYDFARKNDLRVVEDAAHAFGTQYNGRAVGSFGDVTCFSFDGIKNITSGEGGCVVTDDMNVIQYVRDARLLGVVKDSDQRQKGERSWEFDVTTQGWRYHMSDIMASIGLAQLKRFEELAQVRRARARKYDDLLRDCEYIKPLVHDYASVVPHIYPVQLHRSISRSELRIRLLDHGIQTGIHYQPNHLLSFYTDNNSQSLPVTEAIYQSLLTLPLHPDLSEEDVDFVVTQLRREIELC